MINNCGGSCEFIKDRERESASFFSAARPSSPLAPLEVRPHEEGVPLSGGAHAPIGTRKSSI